jgi:hypothetical protein
MLKINLLPAYFRQRRLVKRAIGGVIVAAILTAGGFLYWNSTLQKQAQDLQQQIDALMPTKTEAERLQQEAGAVLAQIGPIQTQLAFLDQVVALPEKWCAILQNAAKYTHAQVPLRSMTISGNSLSMQGHTPNLRTAARYLLNAMRNPEWTQVTINGPQGYPASNTSSDVHPRFRPMDYDLQISATLANPVSMPSPPGGGGGGGGGGGMMGPGMGMPGEMGGMGSGPEMMGPGPGMDPSMGGSGPPPGAPPGAP